MYLITGATGNIGSRLVNLLHEQGHEVRALVRSAARAEALPDGIDIAVGDLDDADSVTAALNGVDSVFLLHAAPGTGQTQIMADAARATGVQRVVLLSSIGARIKPASIIGQMLADREDLLAASDLDVTYLRPNTLSSNALWWADEIREHGRVTDPTGEGRTPPIDPDDIARVAARVLTEDGHVGRGYILNGPEALTAREQVEILADVVGRTIEFVDSTPEQVADAAIANGTPEPAARALQNLNEMFRAGRAGVVTDDVFNVTGVAPRSFRDWCERHVDAFSAAPAAAVA